MSVVLLGSESERREQRGNRIRTPASNETRAIFWLALGLERSESACEQWTLYCRQQQPVGRRTIYSAATSNHDVGSCDRLLLSLITK
jgi:hypothetical protein